MSSDSDRTPASATVAIVQASLLALSTQIDRLDGLAATEFGLNRTDLRALDLIRRAGAPAPTALADALGFTTGGVTTVIDRLERAGYVRRQQDPADRRRVVLEPTETVAQREAEIYGRLIEETMRLIASYSAAQRTAIDDFLTRVTGIVASHADRIAQAQREKATLISPGR